MSSRYSLLLCIGYPVNYQEHQLVLHELGRYVQLLRDAAHQHSATYLDFRAVFFSSCRAGKCSFHTAYTALISLQMNLLVKTEKREER